MSPRRLRGSVRVLMRSPAWMVAGGLLLAGPAGGQDQADLLLYNGRIFTADAMGSLQRAVAVRGGRILAVGGDELVRRYHAAQMIDLQGRLVVPGFNDTHIHVRGYPRHYVDMQGVRSIAEFQDRLRQKAEQLGPGAWITGWGWSEDELAERRRPLRWDLDEAVPRNPAVIARAGGHSAVANTLALQAGGVTRSTPDPPGGLIERDSTGEATGIFRENWGMLTRHVPAATAAEIQQSLFANLRALFAHGITSIIEAMTAPTGYASWQTLYQAHGDSLPRAAVQIHIPVGINEGQQAAERIRGLPMRFGQGDHRLRVGAIKLFVDGGYTGPAAWTLEHYRGEPDYYGKPRLSEQDLYLVLRAAHAAGWQVGVHAIGDAAIKATVDQLVRVLEENPRPNHRHYLNHFTVMPPAAAMRAMASHGILIAQQPNFTYTIEGRYVAHLVGERLQTNNPLRTPMAHGIFMALGADIMPTGPLLGIYSAVTRRGMTGAVYGAGERLTVPEALAGYTRNGAYFTFEEWDKGTLEPGKLADMAVLSDDLLTMDPEAIRRASVDLTILGGRIVYDRARATVPTR